MSRPVVVLGAGSLGSLLAARFARRAPVRLVARGAALDALSARKVIQVEGIDAGDSPVEVVSRPELPPAALVLVTVKAYDLAEALRSLAPELGPSHLVVVLQNGLGVQRLAEQVLGREVIRAVTFLAAARLEPGRVAFNAVGKTYFPAAGREVLRAWRSTGLPAVLVPDLLTYVWRKLAINAVVNPLSALLDVPNGELLPLRSTTRGIVEELVAVARALGQPLEGRETLAKVRSSMRQTARNPSSMLQDVRAGRPTEIDWINGAVVRLADRCGIPAPINRQLVEMVHLVERRGAPPGSRRLGPRSTAV